VGKNQKLLIVKEVVRMVTSMLSMVKFQKKSEHIIIYEQTLRFPIQIALTHADNDFIMSCLQRKQNKSKQRSSFLISLIITTPDRN
jgi:hypothetical protein